MSDADRGRPPRKPGPSRGRTGNERPRQPPRPDGGKPPRLDGAKPPRADGAKPPRADGTKPPRADGGGPRRADGDSAPGSADARKPRRPDSAGRPARADGAGRPARADGAGRPARAAGDGRPRRTDSEGRPIRPDSSGKPRRDDAGARARAGGDGRPERPWRFDDDRRRAPRPGGRPTGPGSESRRPDGAGSATPRHDDPEIPETVEAKQLDKVARSELRTLSKDNADWVARHLLMAGRLIDDDPALAHRHALAAARRAGRISVVRETVAITAYATGDFALALRELRTYRRLSGRNDQLPLMVDSERGVGRPDRALELGRSVPRAELGPDVQVALAIAMSGARLDLGDPEAALTELQIPQLDPERAYAWSPALFDAYATVLDELGRTDEAEQWWQRSDRATIALERAELPEGDDVVEVIEEDWDPDAPAH